MIGRVSDRTPKYYLAHTKAYSTVQRSEVNAVFFISLHWEQLSAAILSVMFQLMYIRCDNPQSHSPHLLLESQACPFNCPSLLLL